MNDTDYVEIPWQKLSPEALQGMLEELVSRDGTDYGEQELSTETKISQLRNALAQKRAAIAFCPDSESWTVISKT
ncbi:MAG: YheU family protein [Zhongshania sp.]|uniref:YheU family protein n=1 Tax=Zhongshania guokunii TaxID=641783 RepID=A0ABV3UBL4_9GAMM|nr:YheU family protein [Zhongshania sp.]MDF1691609.1 YheU family protein [Zhongshania sp.]